ncbi:hypothetical protein BDN72DRAFT_732468, partial [Pluteus cervinus]
ENMAEVVWETLTRLDIANRIFTFMLDNASNNDTFVAGIASRAAKAGIFFDPKWARLRCLPHTIHLAAIQLLEAIGALSKESARKARSRQGCYQATVSDPVE